MSSSNSLEIARSCNEQFGSGFGDARAGQPDDGPLPNACDRLPCAAQVRFARIWIHIVEYNLEHSGDTGPSPSDDRPAVHGTSNGVSSDHSNRFADGRTGLSPDVCGNRNTDSTAEWSTVDATGLWITSRSRWVSESCLPWISDRSPDRPSALRCFS